MLLYYLKCLHRTLKMAAVTVVAPALRGTVQAASPLHTNHEGYTYCCHPENALYFFKYYKAFWLDKVEVVMSLSLLSTTTNQRMLCIHWKKYKVVYEWWQWRVTPVDNVQWNSGLHRTCVDQEDRRHNWNDYYSDCQLPQWTLEYELCKRGCR